MTQPSPPTRRRRAALTGRSFRSALRSPTGAIDLASIMVGVIVIGVIAGVIAATVFAVIPWAQNAAAGQGLDAVRTAESVALVQDSKFSDMAGLVSAQRIQPSTTVSVVTNAAGSCYVAASRSATGKVFYSTDTDPTVRPVTALTTTICVTDVVLAALVTGVGGAGTPTPASLTSLTAGRYSTFAQDSTGKLWAWGYNRYGELGDGTTTDRLTPVAVNVAALGTATVTSVVAGDFHTFVRDSNGKYWAWGYNAVGQLGDGSTVNQIAPVAVNVAALGAATITSIAAGQYFTTAVASDGKVWTWGQNAYGQLGDGTTVSRSAPAAVNVGTAGAINSIAAGESFVVALGSNGKVWAWGRNNWGQLGDGSAVQRETPVAVAATFGGATITSIAAGQYFAVALDSNGKLWSWGLNTAGELGDSSTTQRNAPVPVDATAFGTATITSIAAGWEHVVARDSKGKYWAWGRNDSGQLGDGTLVGRLTPSQLTIGSTTITSVVAGGASTFARDSTGKLWAWGYNNYGQLGDGTSVTRKTPAAGPVLP